MDRTHKFVEQQQQQGLEHIEPTLSSIQYAYTNPNTVVYDFNTGTPITTATISDQIYSIYVKNRSYLSQQKPTETVSETELEMTQKRIRELENPRFSMRLNGIKSCDLKGLIGNLLIDFDQIRYLDCHNTSCLYARFIGAIIRKYYVDSKEHNTIYEGLDQYDQYSISIISNQDRLKYEQDLEEFEGDVQMIDELGLNKVVVKRDIKEEQYNLITMINTTQNTESPLEERVGFLKRKLIVGGYVIVRDFDIHPMDKELLNYVNREEKNSIIEEPFYVPQLNDVMIRNGFKLITFMTYKSNSNREQLFYTIYFREK